MARITGGIRITRGDFNSIAEFAQTLDRGSKTFMNVMDSSAHLWVMLIKGLAEQKYRGPQSGGSPGTIPVRRLTGSAYAGWRVKRITKGAWEVYNEDRGAYMVEYGLGSNKVRRPILKMSVVGSLRFIARTKFANMIMKETFGDLRNNRGQFQSFAARMRGSNIVGISFPEVPRGTGIKAGSAAHRALYARGLARPVRR